MVGMVARSPDLMDTGAHRSGWRRHRRTVNPKVTMPRDFVTEATSRVIANIGQIDKPDQRLLDRAVKLGTISKWRGRWFPEAGAPYGLGPLKTCYGPNDVCAYYAAWRAADSAYPTGQNSV